MNRSYRAWVEVLGAGILTVLSAVFLLELGIPVSKAGGVVSPYDLSVTKTDSPDPVVAGTKLTYTVTATNNDPSNAFPIQITDSLPPGTCFVSVSDTPTGGTCTNPAVGADGAVACTGRPPTAPGGTYSADIVVYVCPSVAKSPPPLSNTGTADGACIPYLDAQGDPMYSLPCNDTNLGDNSSTQLTDVQTQSNLVVTQSVDPSTITPGSKVQYTIVVQNNGPSDSAGTQVTQMLSPGMIVLSVTGATCSGIGSSELTCNLGAISAPLPSPNGDCCPIGPTSAQIIVTAVLASTASGPVITSTVSASSTGNTGSTSNTASDTVTLVVQTPVLGSLGLVACVLLIFAVGAWMLLKRASSN